LDEINGWPWVLPWMVICREWSPQFWLHLRFWLGSFYHCSPQFFPNLRKKNINLDHPLALKTNWNTPVFVNYHAFVWCGILMHMLGWHDSHMHPPSTVAELGPTGWGAILGKEGILVKKCRIWIRQNWWSGAKHWWNKTIHSTVVTSLVALVILAIFVIKTDFIMHYNWQVCWRAIIG
jgi:hypothetical protein